MTPRKILHAAAVALIAGVLAQATLAQADHGHDLRLPEQDRAALRDYIGQHRDKWCPTGLGEDHNGCTAPGQLKYTVGAQLPDIVHYNMLPRDLLHTLSPLPPDVMYIRVGGDVYVMNRTDRSILDAVTLNDPK